MPYNVGFLEQAVQSRETTSMHKARLLKHLPLNTPDFQINLYKANNTDTRATYLVMVQTDKDNVGILTKILQKASKDHDLGFFPWHEYMRLSNIEKQMCLSELRMWNDKYKTIVVNGFNNNEDNVPMQMGEFDKETKKLHTLNNISVSDYLRQVTHPVNGKLMFEYVFPTILGAREFIINVENYGDAESYLEEVQGELARVMSAKSITLEFSKPSEAFRQEMEPAWEPFQRV
jgi:hypothetical protein